MRIEQRMFMAVTAAVVGSVALLATPQTQGAGQAAPAQPQIQLAPGLREVPDYRKVALEPPPAKLPDGFVSIFNGKDLTGWLVIPFGLSP